MSNFKKRSCVALLVVLIGVALMLPLFSLRAYAEASSAAESTNPRCKLTSATGIADLVATCKANVKYKSGLENSFLSVTGTAGTTIVVKMTWYDSLTLEQKQDVMSATLSSINSSSLIQRDKTRLYNFVCDLDKSTASLVRQLSEDVDADFARGYSWFKPFSGGISTFLGFMTIIIFVVLALSILVDTAYLAIPIFRLGIESVCSKNGGGNEKPFMISNEAYRAVLQSESDPNSNKSAMSLYLKSKTVQFIIIAICLLYLVGGKLFDFVARLIDAFNGAV